ncbi:hypothetical protein D3C86_1031240 [compost metagenome]
MHAQRRSDVLARAQTLAEGADHSRREIIGGKQQDDPETALNDRQQKYKQGLRPRQCLDIGFEQRFAVLNRGHNHVDHTRDEIGTVTDHPAENDDGDGNQNAQMQDDAGKRIPGKQIIRAAEFGGRTRQIGEMRKPARRDQREDCDGQRKKRRHDQRADDGRGDDRDNGGAVAPAHAGDEDRHGGTGIKQEGQRRLCRCAKRQKRGAYAGENAGDQHCLVQLLHFAVLLKLKQLEDRS